MGWLLLLIAAVFFFLAAVGAAIIPNPTAWGLFFLALGLAVGGRGAGLFRGETP